MNKVRKKRKPDTLKVNFVVGNSGSRELNIQPVTYLFKKATHDDSGRAGSHISNSITDSLPPPPSSTTAFFPSGGAVTADDGVLSSDSCRRKHTVRKEKSAEAWSTVRPQIIPSMITASGFPASDTLCIFCKASPVSVWCPDCGPIAYFCLVLHNDV